MATNVSRLVPHRPEHQGGTEGITAPATQALGFGGVLAAGGVLAFTALQIPLICPLRSITGIPCPLCGMTTGTVALLRGDLSSSVSANPFAPGFVLAAAAAFVDGLRRWAGRPSILGLVARVRAVRRLALPLLVAAALISWIFQLYRFDVL